MITLSVLGTLPDSFINYLFSCDEKFNQVLPLLACWATFSVALMLKNRRLLEIRHVLTIEYPDSRWAEEMICLKFSPKKTDSDLHDIIILQLISRSMLHYLRDLCVFIGVIRKPPKPRKPPAPHRTAPQNAVFNFRGAVAVWIFHKPRGAVRVAVLVFLNAVQTAPHRNINIYNKNNIYIYILYIFIYIIINITLSPLKLNYQES